MNQPPSSPLPVRILIVDDDEDDFWLINDQIQDIPDQKFQVDWCPNYTQGSLAIRNATHDIYFIDYHLGAKTGIDLLKEALAHECRQPIILLTGQGNMKIDLEAMQSGAADYLTKSQITSEQIERCIRYSLVSAALLRDSQASLRNFKSIFERSKDAIFLSSTGLDFNNVNAAASELLEYTAEELLHLNFSGLFADPPEKEILLRILEEQEEVVDHQIELITKNGTRKNCILSCTLETDPSGNRYVQGMLHDISLLQRVDEIKLQSEKLEAKGMIIRTLAHEIRNPLHNIILSIDFLKGQATMKDEEFLNVIERNSKRINDLINELMDSNQYYKLKLEVLPLQMVLQESLALAADRIRLRKIELVVDFPPHDAKVLVDKEKIKIAFHNMVVNAIEAMKDGQGTLTISINSKGRLHKVCISDNGCGMKPEHTARLFEPYFTTKVKGMGLGLPAARAILQSHKAEIEVASREGQGTTFTISFPAL